jgi:hypothetical protein
MEMEMRYWTTYSVDVIYADSGSNAVVVVGE